MPEPTRSNSSNALLVQIITDIAEIKATVRGYADLETRVRELEKARWQSIAPLVGTQLIAGSRFSLFGIRG